MGRFRVYAIGGIKYVDIEEPRIDGVEELYRKAVRDGYVIGRIMEDDRVRTILIPVRGIGVVTDEAD